MKDISVVVPVFNEEKNIPVLYERLKNTLTKLNLDYEIIFVNDGSADGSENAVLALKKQDNNVVLVAFTRNFGHQEALFAGLEESCGKLIVTIDSDLQDPPELIEQLFEHYKKGYKIVNAKRRSRKGVNIFKKLSYLLFYRLLKLLSSVEIPLDTGDYRMFDRDVLEVILSMNEKSKFLRGQFAWTGFSRIDCEYDRDPRLEGEPGYSFNKLLKLALDGIFSFSDIPLKMASIFGFLISAISFVLGTIIIIIKFTNPDSDVQGWYSIMVSVLFLGGIQLISIGVIGEYISRLNKDVKNRPLYVKKKNSE